MNRFEVLPPIQKKKVRFIHLNHSNPLLDPGLRHPQLLPQRVLLAVEGEKIEL